MSSTSRAQTAALKLEVVVIPVSDVDRAKRFYDSLGWRLDADFPFDTFRVVQFTPPGSSCSVQFGTNITPAAPGSAHGLYLVVSDIEAARAELVDRGVDVSEVFHAGKPGAQFQPNGANDPQLEWSPAGIGLCKAFEVEIITFARRLERRGRLA